MTAAEYVALANAEAPEHEILTRAAQAGFVVDTAYEALLHESSLVALRSLLAKKPVPFDTVARTVFMDDDRALAGLTALASIFHRGLGWSWLVLVCGRGG